MTLRGLDIDDYLMLLAFVGSPALLLYSVQPLIITSQCFYTSLVITLNLTALGGGSALAFPGDDVYTLPEAEVKSRIKGAKIDLVAEQSMLNVIWVLKACMLLLYNRLT